MTISITRVISVGNLNVESGSGYEAMLAQSFVQPDATINRVQRDADSSVVTHLAPGLNEYILSVIVDATTADADTVDARRRALLRALDTTRDPVTVVIENAAGTARRRYMRCVVAKVDQVTGQNGSGFAARLQPADDVRWRSTTAVEETWTLTASGSRSLSVAGDLEVYPTYTFTPRASKSAANWPYRRRVVIYWQSDLGGAHPIDVTGGGISTTALLSAGKVTDGTNIGIVMNGSYMPYSYGAADGTTGGFNSTSTRIWVNMTFKPQTIIQTAEYISTTATTWRVKNDSGLPAWGTLDIEGEFISYGWRTPGYLHGVRRGLYETTPSEHIAGADAEWVQGIGYILYGPDGAVPESAKGWDWYNHYAPIFLGGSSTNTTWRYYLNFNDPPAPGGFIREHNQGATLAFVNASTADGGYVEEWTYPWTALGLLPGSAALSRFRGRFAVPIKQVRILGRHYAPGNPAQYPRSPRLALATDDQKQWAMLWNAADGVGRTPNPTFDVTPTAIPIPYAAQFNQIVWGWDGSNYVQADIQEMFVTFQDGYVPVVEVGAEDSDYDLDITLDNQTTNESLRVEYPNMTADESIVVDSDRNTAVYEATGENLYTSVRRDALRPKFLRLVPGTNEFVVTEDGMGTMEVTIRYEPRWYA